MRDLEGMTSVHPSSLSPPTLAQGGGGGGGVRVYKTPVHSYCVAKGVIFYQASACEMVYKQQKEGR